MWRKFRDLSIAEYKKIYARLNVEFDVYSGESQQTEGMVRALKELNEKELLFEDRGAKLINLEVIDNSFYIYFIIIIGSSKGRGLSFYNYLWWTKD